MIDNLATHAATRDATADGRGRAASIALWTTQVVLAAMFLLAGGSKLVGAPVMIALFDAIGVGQWFRFLTGAIELTAGLALLVPRVAAFGALLLIPTMLGAAMTNVLVAHASPAVPLLLLVGAAAVAWARRRQLRNGLWTRGRGQPQGVSHGRPKTGGYGSRLSHN
jgi:putative oxidoreductase